MSMIQVEGLSKEFKIYKRYKGFFSTFKSLFHREYEIKKAVADVTFSVAQGELVGYIGRNGAGKSTTIKMLTGILEPTSGSVRVCGVAPHLNRKENARRIGVVFGQRSQLYWDLPLIEALPLYKKMYKVPDDVFQKNIDRFVDMLEMREFVNRPIRQLSLGQKMRAELMVAFLHNPEIVYLDEPTIGLDTLAKKNIRNFIRDVNAERNTTIILTTHDMDDIERICNRIILIDDGKLIYDAGLSAFKERYGNEHNIRIRLSEPARDVVIEGDGVLEKSFDKEGVLCIRYDVARQNSATILQAVLAQCGIVDFTVSQPSLEEIVETIYHRNASGSVGGA